MKKSACTYLLRLMAKRASSSGSEKAAISKAVGGGLIGAGIGGLGGGLYGHLRGKEVALPALLGAALGGTGGALAGHQAERGDDIKMENADAIQSVINGIRQGDHDIGNIRPTFSRLLGKLYTIRNNNRRVAR